MNILRPESYLSPFIVSYLSKYVKDLESKDLKLSIWGGDAVLHNLQFNLNALNDELGGVPFQFVSCQTEELRIHVPWSKLSSEPVVVTLNTVECVLKLHCVKKSKKPSSKPGQEETATQVQPSYIENLIKKIKNNISIVVNNLILKYVEDDIVLSVNVQTVNYRSCDENWQPAFIEMTEDKPVLRQTCEFSDTTVCLDKRGSNGLVESCEDPMLFRCLFQFRIHTQYPSHLHRKPLAVKINLFVERYELTISEVQLPAFLHLCELCLHIYYKRIEMKTEQNETGGEEEKQDESDQGWASWAWSYVPPIINYEEVEAIEVKNSIFAFSLYFKHFVVRFKPSLSSGSQQFHKFRNCSEPSLLNLNAEGVSVEMVAKGLDFFSCVTRLCKCSAIYDGGLPSSLNGMKLNSNFSETNISLASAGSSVVGFSADSLFDFRSPENNNTFFRYALTEDEFFETNSDNSSDAFFSQYLYIATDGRPEEEKAKLEFYEFLKTVKLTNVNEWDNTQEQSWKKFVIGGDDCQIIVSSYTFLCLEILLAWSKNHDHKPYPLVAQSTVKVPKTIKENINMNFIPSRSTVILLKNLTISILSLHLQLPSQEETLFHRIDALVNPSATQFFTHDQNVGVKLPTTVFVIPEASFGILQPMYGAHFSAYLAKFLSPMSRLMSLCNTRYNMDVKSIQLYTWFSDLKHYCPTYVPPHVRPFVHIMDTLAESYSLQGEEFWKKRKTMLKRQSKSTIQSLSSEFTSFQVEMFLHVVDSWSSLYKSNCLKKEVLDLSFLQSKFEDHSWESMNVNFNNFIVEVNESFNAVSLGGALRSIDISFPISENSLIPLMKCDNNCEIIHEPMEFINLSNSPRHQLHEKTYQTADWSQDTHWLSGYMFYPNEPNDNGCVLINIGQVALNIDPILLKFVSNVPQTPLQNLMPNCFSCLQFSNNSKESTSEVQSTEFNFRYALQLNMEGVHILLPQCSVGIDKQSNKSASLPSSIRSFIKKQHEIVEVLCICFPKISSYTSGHKPVKLSPNLLTSGMAISNFTEFGTLNFGLEKMSVYTVMGNSSKIKALCVVDQCAATCTVASSKLGEIKTKTNLAVHLDVEPINIKISASQVKLLVKCLNSFLFTSENLVLNFKVSPKPPSQINRGLSKDTLAHNERETNNNSEKENSKKTSVNLDAQVANATTLLPFTMWLQCTLPRFSVSMYSTAERNSKLSFVVEDISLSLDCQSVYLKLKSCFTSCSAMYGVKRNTTWDFGDFNGILFEPMFSRIPSFVKTYDEPIRKVSVSDEKLDSKKFFDVTFTRALTADYHHQLIDESRDSADVSISSVDRQSNINRCVNEIICLIQAFDFLLKPQVIIDTLDIFYPLKLIETTNKKQVESAPLSFDWPAVYLNISGIRCFLPTSEKGNVLMGCLKEIDVNPCPLNSLPRLVLSPSIYKKAKAMGLLNKVGSMLQDKQYELNVQDISIGTCKWNDILNHMKKPVHIENPALQWNSGRLFPDPIYHPIIQQFDIQATIAPPIWYQSAHNIIAICAPSVELNLVNDMVCHIAAMHLSVLMDTLQLWSNINSVNKTKLTEVVLEKNEIKQHYDSGFSVVESSHNSERRVIPANLSLMGDFLLTGHKVKILFYHYQNADEKQSQVMPFLDINIFDPSLACNISEQQQTLNLQVHDINVQLSDQGFVNETLLQNKTCFPSKVFETRAGNCDKRTGVPLSLITISAENILTKRAKVKLQIGRPIKISICDRLFDRFSGFLVSMKHLIYSEDLGSSKKSAPKPQGSRIKISALSAETQQIVVDLKMEACHIRMAATKLSVDMAMKQNMSRILFKLNDSTVRIKVNKEKFLPCLLPVNCDLTISVTPISKCSRNKINLHVGISNIRLSLIRKFASGISSLVEIFQEKIEKLKYAISDEDNKALPAVLNPIPLNHKSLNLDSLRTTNYTYISSNNLKPHDNQIVFSDDAMTWSYPYPSAINRVCINPIPFIETDVDQIGIPCFLEIFDVLTGKYNVLKEFTLSETKVVELILFDDNTPLPSIKVSLLWRVRLVNNEYCKIVPKSLALAMQVDSVHDTSLIPSIVADVCIDQIIATYFIQQHANQVEIALGTFESVCLSGISWDSDVETLVNFDMKWMLDMMEFQCLTWVPLILPTEMRAKVHHNLNSLKLSLDFEKEVEIHVGGRAIHSFDYMLNNIVTPLKTTNHIPCVCVRNCTSSALLFGQALTDECIILQPSEIYHYIWRSNKVDLKLHISAKQQLQLNWSEAFSVQETITFYSHSEDSGIVVSINSINSWNKEVTFYGETRFKNRLPFDVDIMLTTAKGSVVKTCSTLSEILSDLPYKKSNIIKITLKVSNIDAGYSEPVDLTEFTAFTEDTKMIQFDDGNGEKINCQLCHVEDELVDVIYILPVFIICSYLPFDSILHVETRSLKQTKSVTLPGNGNTMPLLYLSPFNKHHLTIQLNEHQSPFDATLPIHFSLTNTMVDSSKLTDAVADFSKHYPYNQMEMDNEYDEIWSPGDGNIQAKLSMYCRSLFVEITPWCLLSNKTEMALCFSSSDEATVIVQPNQVAVPHHFHGPFFIRTSNNVSSEWLTLSKPQQFNHPSRPQALLPSHIPYNGSQRIKLEKQAVNLGLNIQSTVRHGIRVLTLLPRWWFVNLSSVENMLVTPYEDLIEDSVHHKDKAFTVNNKDPIPIYQWFSSDGLDVSNQDESNANGGSVATSSKESTSSFICVDSDITKAAVAMKKTNQSLHIKALNYSAKVYVEGDFSRTLVKFCDQNKSVQKVLLLTKHDYLESLYLVVSDVKKSKYQIFNTTDIDLQISEPNDSDLFFDVPAKDQIVFESFSSFVDFPRCTRKHVTLLLKISEKNTNNHAHVEIFSEQYVEKILLDTKEIFLHIVLKNSYVNIYISENSEFKQEVAIQDSYTFSGSFSGVKFVLFDDLSHPLYSRDIMHCFLDKVQVNCENLEVDLTWVATLSINSIQCDNHFQLYPDFPVFLYTCSTDNPMMFCLTLTSDFALDKINMSLKPMEFKIENDFAQVLAKVLQSFLETVHTPSEEKKGNSILPIAVLNDVDLLTNPLRFQQFIVEPLDLLVSFRTEIKVRFSVDRSSIKFSKFACRDLDTTAQEILQEIIRHYVADAVYGAGWVIGSLDLLGNPANVFRSYAQGVGDFLMLPYEGLKVGPKAFVGGVTRGVSSLLLHLSSGTIRSFTNIASSISRNLNDNQEQVEERRKLRNMLRSMKDQAPQPEHGYVAGVGKTLVGLVTKPIGGAAGMMSKAGETILKKVGLEFSVSQKHASSSHAVADYENSATKFAMKMFTENDSSSFEVFPLVAQMLSSGGFNFDVVLVLSPDNLYIVRSEDDSIDCVIPVADINLSLKMDPDNKAILTIQQVTQPEEIKDGDYSEKVADYLGVSTPEITNTDASDCTKYTAQVDDLLKAKLFLSMFNSIKPRENKFEW